MSIVLYTLSISLMILMPVLFAVMLRRRYNVLWLLFCAGALTFLASQAVHFPLNDALTNLGLLGQPGQPDSPPLWQICAVLGLTAGICEELARAAGYAILRRYRRFEHGFMLGLGHGGIEAMVFGGVLVAATLSSLFPLIGTDLSQLNLPADQQQALTAQIEYLTQYPFSAFTPLLERFLAMCTHVMLSLLVLEAFKRKRGWFFVPLAILYHAVVDGILVYLSNIGWEVWGIYPLMAGMLVPGWAWLLWQRSKAADRALPGITTPLSREMYIFLASVKKELLQQWRSRRILAVMAVFILFGFTSPLLAYLIPDIFQSISGMEQFSQLIPQPSAADAMGQYVKNLTQFGFILALLLGMNAVAGEKEQKTAVQILSKPMPRWAFITSKFTAQGFIYLLAFLLSMLGAFYYTVILFGWIPFDRFALINLLLFLWLLTFVSMTLIGSVIARSTPAAAGIALAGSVVLLLSGYIPKIGMLLPGGLVASIGQIGATIAGEASPVNWGAAALAVVISLMGVIISIAIFEKQEL